MSRTECWRIAQPKRHHANIEQHLAQLSDVLAHLKGAGLKIRPKKCRLLQTSVQYLGHIISGEGVRTDPAKISCVANWPIPRNKADLQRFLGFASYYRRFVRSFAQLASPLHALLRKVHSGYGLKGVIMHFLS